MNVLLTMPYSHFSLLCLTCQTGPGHTAATWASFVTSGGGSCISKRCCDLEFDDVTDQGAQMGHSVFPAHGLIVDKDLAGVFDGIEVHALGLVVYQDLAGVVRGVELTSDPYGSGNILILVRMDQQ